MKTSMLIIAYILLLPIGWVGLQLFFELLVSRVWYPLCEEGVMQSVWISEPMQFVINCAYSYSVVAAGSHLFGWLAGPNSFGIVAFLLSIVFPMALVRHLQQVIGAPAISLSCLRRRLIARGWRRLRPRISIIRRDPKREEKLAAIEAQKGGCWQRTPMP